MVVLCSEDDEDDEEDEDDDDEEDECAMMGGTGEVIMCDDIWCSLRAWRWSIQVCKTESQGLEHQTRNWEKPGLNPGQVHSLYVSLVSSLRAVITAWLNSSEKLSWTGLPGNKI